MEESFEQHHHQQQQQQQDASLAVVAPVQESDRPNDSGLMAPPWALLSPGPDPDPQMAHSSLLEAKTSTSEGRSGASFEHGADERNQPELRELRQRLQLAQAQIQMLLTSEAQLLMKLSLCEKQNLMLLKQHEEDQALNRSNFCVTEELTKRLELVEREKEQYKQENEQLRQQMQELTSRLTALIDQRSAEDGGQGTGDVVAGQTELETRRRSVSLSSLQSVVLHGMAYVPTPPSSDVQSCQQVACSTPQNTQTVEDTSVTARKGQGSGVKRSKPGQVKAKRRFMLQQQHLECSACHCCFDSELAASQSPCLFHEKQAVWVPSTFWTQSQRSPGSLGSSQQEPQSADMPPVPPVPFWPCCQQTGCRARPCCKNAQHSLVSLRSKS